jgi:hypothetical protein
VTAGAGLVIAKFVKVDYAFESHPVLSPVHRVSVSISPYLFSHAPKPGTPEAASGRSKNLTEEPDDETSYEDMEREPYEDSRAADNAPEQGSAPDQEQSTSEAQSESPAAASPPAAPMQRTPASSPSSWKRSCPTTIFPAAGPEN